MHSEDFPALPGTANKSIGTLALNARVTIILFHFEVLVFIIVKISFDT